MKRLTKTVGISLIALGLLFTVNVFATNNNNSIFDKDITVNQEDETCSEYEIKTPALDKVAEYIATIEDPVKKDLVEKYFYLPDAFTIGEKPESAKEEKVDIDLQIKTVDEMGLEELKKIVEEKEEKFLSGNLEIINYDDERISSRE